MPEIHQPARLATRAASFRYGGRHHPGIPGGIIPLYPGGFVGIGSQSQAVWTRNRRRESGAPDQVTDRERSC
jgi:hypothetical protein